MLFFEEYHGSMRHLILASVAALSLSLLPVSAHAQINGAPASVTSPGFGGRAVNGTAPSVTSVGPRGYSSNSRATISTTTPNKHHEADHHRRRNERYGGVYAVPVPYAVDNGVDENANDDAEYQGGPTIFDRRGSGARSYIPPVNDVSSPHAENTGESLSDPAPSPDPTLLVLKDGQTLEVGNYAIVGTTLFDMSPGRTRKIPIADLDLDATYKQNEDRGVVFQLPPSLRSN